MRICLLLLSLACITATGAFAQKEKWVSLFDGKSLKGWRTYQHKPATSWRVSDGMLFNIGNGDAATKHADLVTEETYENFILEIDWKIAPKANSGILYMVSEDYPASYESGPEYQLIDDANYPAKLEGWQKTGANYAMEPPLVDATRPAGEWNHTRIIVNKGHVEHWLNGKQVAAYDMGSERWQQQRLAGKWKDTKSYASEKKGRIALQDHGGEVWFRNIRIQIL